MAKHAVIAEDDDCDLRRDRIVYFATHAFLSRGYNGSSLEEIAVAAGVSKLTIYRAFGNKADLLREVIVRAMTRMIGSVTSPLDPLAPVEDTLTAYCAQYIAAMYRPVVSGAPFYHVSRLIITTTVDYPEFGQEFVSAYVSISRPAVFEYLTALISTERLPPFDVEFATTFFFHMMFFTNGAILRPPHSPGDADIEADARRRVRFFLRGCGGC